MAPNRTQIREYADHKAPSPASPSASIILISPTNQVLLLHRVQTSSAFPSAHVFPGGNLEASDGTLPSEPTDPNRHLDSLTYRTGAIRELFEESGILLAKPNADSHRLLEVSATDRAQARKAIHAGKVRFGDWLKSHSPDAVLDTQGLTPFTHWVTPPNVPKRFTTQMYVYFVHLRETGNPSVHATSDEVETMAPEWRPAHAWLSAANRGDVILFPPQFLLLHFVSQFLDHQPLSSSSSSSSDNGSSISSEEIVSRRRKLYEFITTDGSPTWSQKFISPIGLPGKRADGRQVLVLDKPGPELRKSGYKGDDTRVVLVKFKKEGPRELEVAFRKDAVAELEGNKNKEGEDRGSKL